MSENHWKILEKIKTPFSGLLQLYYMMVFESNKVLTDDQKLHALACLLTIAEDEKNGKDVRVWCYNQFGLIHSGMSNFIKVS